MARPNLSALISKFLFRETLTTQDKADIRTDLEAETAGAAAAVAAAKHDASADLTAYADAADAAARRALIGAADAATNTGDEDTESILAKIGDGERIGAEYMPDALPLDSFSLQDFTSAALGAGNFASDLLGRICRHDGTTIGGVPITPQRYAGMKVLDYTGKGGSGVGTLTDLVELVALFAGDVAEWDVVEITGITTFQLDPSDLPNVIPAFQGYAIGDVNAGPTQDFWDLSNSAGTNVFQDTRFWSARFELSGGAWVCESPACYAVQQVTSAAGGPASIINDGRTAIAGAPAFPAPSGGLLTIPVKFALIDQGSPFSSGTARISWDFLLTTIRA
jgi:hypothetical protein